MSVTTIESLEGRRLFSGGAVENDETHWVGHDPRAAEPTGLHVQTSPIDIRWTASVSTSHEIHITKVTGQAWNLPIAGVTHDSEFEHWANR